MKYLKIIFLFIAVTLSYVACQEEAENKETSTPSKEPQYVGSNSCKSCHTVEHKEWKTSDHFHAMEEPTQASVLGDFSKVEFSADGVDYFFDSAENHFYITTKENDSVNSYKVKYTFGVYPLQNYLVETEDGKVQTLRATWDSEKNLWFHQRAGETIPNHDWLHWTNQSQNWNSMCASCHSTNLDKNLSKDGKNYTTQFSEINVACEACHGPGSKHINMVANEDYANTNSGLFKTAKSNIEEVEQCAPCHSRRTELTDKFTVDQSFLDQFMPQTINNVFYEADGQIKEEDYVYASFVSSKMYHKDVKCSDCHNPHSGKLKLEGNLLCMQCHEPEYNTKAHHFHDLDTESAQCVNCHMTGKTYMGNDFRRDHSFRIPRPDQSIEYGTSNACNNCHDKKSSEWAADQIIKWYGNKRSDHFSDHLLPGSEGDINELLKLINNKSYPGIARATAIEYLSNHPIDLYASQINAWRKDSAGIVRLEVAKLAFNFPEELKMSTAAPLLKDKSRAVRIAAFRTLINSYDLLSKKDQQHYLAVEKEYSTFLYHNADFKEGQQNLAQYFASKQNAEKTKFHFKHAIEIDSLFFEPYLNLAIVQNQLGENESALNTLNKLTDKNPTNDYAFYLKALLYAELNDLERASKNIASAIKLAPSPNYYYNAILIERSLKSSRAEKYLGEAIKLYPQNPRLQQLVTNY